MTRTEILSTLQRVFDDVFVEPVVVHEGLSARDVPEWDSLTHIPLILSVERAFAIRLRMGDVATTRTVGELMDLIAQRLASG